MRCAWDRFRQRRRALPPGRSRARRGGLGASERASVHHGRPLSCRRGAGRVVGSPGTQLALAMTIGTLSYSALGWGRQTIPAVAREFIQYPRRVGQEFTFLSTRGSCSAQRATVLAGPTTSRSSAGTTQPTGTVAFISDSARSYQICAVGHSLLLLHIVHRQSASLA